MSAAGKAGLSERTGRRLEQPNRDPPDGHQAPRSWLTPVSYTHLDVYKRQHRGTQQLPPACQGQPSGVPALCGDDAEQPWQLGES